MGVQKLRSYRGWKESAGSMSGMRTSSGLLRGSCRKLLRLYRNRKLPAAAVVQGVFMHIGAEEKNGKK